MYFMKEGGSIQRPPLHYGKNYSYWKAHMKAITKSTDVGLAKSHYQLSVSFIFNCLFFVLFFIFILHLYDVSTSVVVPIRTPLNKMIISIGNKLVLSSVLLRWVLKRIKKIRSPHGLYFKSKVTGRIKSHYETKMKIFPNL